MMRHVPIPLEFLYGPRIFFPKFPQISFFEGSPNPFLRRGAVPSRLLPLRLTTNSNPLSASTRTKKESAVILSRPKDGEGPQPIPTTNEHRARTHTPRAFPTRARLTSAPGTATTKSPGTAPSLP